jgi:hypothetical protein
MFSGSRRDVNGGVNTHEPTSTSGNGKQVVLWLLLLASAVLLLMPAVAWLQGERLRRLEIASPLTSVTLIAALLLAKRGWIYYALLAVAVILMILRVTMWR